MATSTSTAALSAHEAAPPAAEQGKAEAETARQYNLLGEYTDKAGLARMFQVSTKTVERWSNEVDGLPYVQLPGKRLYSFATTREWLESRTRHPNPRRKAA